MAEVRARGLGFHVQTLGDGEPVVVFVHGLVLDNLSSFYYTLAGPVAAAGAQSVLYDLRGHGRSERPPAGYGAGDAVADLFGILDALGHLRPVYLVANSFGGAIALNAALARPERIAGLVLVEAHGPAEGGVTWSEDMLNTLSRAALGLEYERLADQLFAIGWRQRGRQALVCDELINGTTLLDDLAAMEPIRPADLTRVRCPVLAAYGEHSDVVPAGRLLEEHVPDCTLHLVAGMGHTILRDATGELLEVMLGWLAERAGTSLPVGAGA